MALNPDAAELLGTPVEQPRDAQGKFVPKDPAIAPQAETPPAAPAAPAAPPAGFVPLAAVEGEQRATAAKMARVRESLEPQGYTVLDDGTIIPPAAGSTGYAPAGFAFPSPTVPVDPFIQSITDGSVIGRDPAEVQRDFDAYVGRVVERAGIPILGPIAQGSYEQFNRELAQSDPDYTIYAKTMEKEFVEFAKTLTQAQQIRALADRQLHERIRAVAYYKHRDELAKRATERATGRVVGTFKYTEGAAPSAVEGTAASLPPDVAAIASEWGLTPEQQARAAARRAERRAR